MTIQSLGAFLQSIHASNLTDLAGYASAQPGYTAFVDTLKCGFVATTANLTTADGYSVMELWAMMKMMDTHQLPL